LSTALSHNSVTNAIGAHLHFQGPKTALSANTTQIYRRKDRHSIRCCYLPTS